MMTVIFFEVLTVGAILAFTIVECISMSWKSESLDKEGKKLWDVRARRIGPAKMNIYNLFLKNKMFERIALEEERYLAGNRMRDDFYIDVSGKRIRLFINVQQDKIYLTVLKGLVEISNCIYEADKTRRIEINDMTRVVVSDIELEFIRKRGI